MTNYNTCDLADGPALAERYVARRMDEGERIGFENHFVACAECQGEVRLAEAIRASAAAAPRASAAGTLWLPRRGARGTRLTRPARWLGGGIAIAAGIAAIVMLRAAPAPALERLGAVIEPPMYLGVSVRGSADRADPAFDRAMDDYRAKNFAAAASGLRAVLAAGQDSVPADFFLGASELMANDAEGAAAAFARVIARGDTPYLDEAQLYAAKALIRLGRAREALDVMAKRKPSDPLLAGAIAALSDSVTRLIAR